MNPEAVERWTFKDTPTQLRLERVGEWINGAADASARLSRILGLVMFCFLWVPPVIVAELFWQAMMVVYCRGDRRKV